MMLFRVLDAQKEKGFFEVELNGKVISNRSDNAIVLNRPNVVFPGLIRILLEDEDGNLIVARHKDEWGEYFLPKKRWRFGLIRWRPI